MPSKSHGGNMYLNNNTFSGQQGNLLTFERTLLQIAILGRLHAYYMYS